MQMLPIASTSGNLREAGFEDGKMRVTFKSGASYEYEVTPEKWEEFSKTFPSKETSSGSYFAKNFKTMKFTKL